MSRYRHLRSVSPSHGLRNDHEVELQEQVLEKTRGSVDEQRERLLYEDGEAEDHFQPEIRDGTRKQRRKWWHLTFFGFAGLAVIAVVAALLHRLYLWEVQHEDSRAFHRPSSDYVIDPKWDYSAKPTVREYHWTISDVTANPDGVFRPMMVINGQFPGPMIVCNEGDTVVVTVVNEAKNATAIHWHGLFQNGTNFMDGTVGITQCPIAPGQSYRYEFKVQGQAGSCKLDAPPTLAGDNAVTNCCQTSTTHTTLPRAWTASPGRSSSSRVRRGRINPFPTIQTAWSWSRTGTTMPRMVC